MLIWTKPEKLRPTEEHNKLCSSDSGIPGTFVPNMTQTNAEAYKARFVKGQVPRIEVRVTIQGTQVLIKTKNRMV